MRKVSILALTSVLFLTSCTQETNSSNPSFSSENNTESPSQESSSSSDSNDNVLDSFLKDASSSYSIKAIVDQYTDYYGLVTKAKNYLDVAGKEDYFSITKYSQVFDDYGSIDRNNVDSDARYKSYDYEGSRVVSSSYLNMNNEICYSVHKDNYGYTTEWEKSFNSFFADLTSSDFISEDQIVYKLNVETLENEVSDEILYQLGCLSVSSVTSLHVEELSLSKENDEIKKISFKFVDDADSNVYTSYSIEGDIVTGENASKDVKVEEVVTGAAIEELDSAFKSLKNYNFDFSLQVTISRNVSEEYGASAEADGNEVISNKFAYVETKNGLEYYVSPTSDGNVYKTMETVAGASLETLLPSFDISTYFFTKAAKNTYIFSNKAKRCSPSSKDFSIYQPFSLSFSSLTIKLGDNSVSITGSSGTYQFDISYTNIGKKETLEFSNDSTFGYGDYLSRYSWSYEDYIECFREQLSLENTDGVYEVMNNLPTYYSYRMSGTPYFLFELFSIFDSKYGIEYEYDSKEKRDMDFKGLISFYQENGFAKVSEDEKYTLMTKKITVNEEEKILGLRIKQGKNYEIPIIGVFPLFIEE